MNGKRFRVEEVGEIQVEEEGDRGGIVVRLCGRFHLSCLALFNQLTRVTSPEEIWRRETGKKDGDKGRERGR